MLTLLLSFSSPGALSVSTRLHFLTRWSPGSCTSYMVSQGSKGNSLREEGGSYITFISLSQKQSHSHHIPLVTNKSPASPDLRAKEVNFISSFHKGRARLKNIWTGRYLKTIFRKYNLPWSPIHKQVVEKTTIGTYPCGRPSGGHLRMVTFINFRQNEYTGVRLPFSSNT